MQAHSPYTPKLILLLDTDTSSLTEKYQMYGWSFKLDPKKPLTDKSSSDWNPLRTSNPNMNLQWTMFIDQFG